MIVDLKLKSAGLAALAITVILSSGFAVSAATLSLKGGQDFTLGSKGAFDPQPGGSAYTSHDPDAVMRIGSVVKTIDGKSKNGDRSLGLSLNSAAKVTFTYLGKEASYLNAFLSIDGRRPGGVFDTKNSSVGDSFTISADVGLLNFGFGTLPTGKAGGSSKKGSKNKNGSYFFNSGKATDSKDIGLAYSSIFNGGKSIILGFNDIARVDADYDDLVVRVDVAPVPLPAAGLLLTGGLGALGVASRRRKTAATA